MKPETSPQSSAFSSKAWWQSRTLIGIAVMILSQLLRHFRVDIIDDELTDMLTLGLDTLGASLAIYGRVHARKALKLTVPGGAFNPKAEVRKAERVGRRAGRPRSGESGRADFDALMIGGFLFLLVGIALSQIPVPVPSREVPDFIGDKPVSEWMQTVRIEDQRPFFVRLVSSIRCVPSIAMVTTEGGSSARITKITLTGRADF